MDRGAWWAIIQWVTKSKTWLSSWAHISWLPWIVLLWTVGFIYFVELWFSPGTNKNERQKKQNPTLSTRGKTIFSYFQAKYRCFPHCTCSVHFSRSLVSDSLRPHELQHARPPCPSPTTRVHSDSLPLSQWCHPAISSSVIPSPPAPHPSQHQSLFQWVNTLHDVAKVLEFQL